MSSLRALARSLRHPEEQNNEAEARPATPDDEAELRDRSFIHLIQPIVRGDMPAIREYLAPGAGITPESPPGYDPFVLAAQRPEPDVARLLLDHWDLHPSPSPEPDERLVGIPLLHIACEAGAVDTVRYLLDERPELAGGLHHRDRCGRTPLLAAAGSFAQSALEEEYDMFDGKGRSEAIDEVRRCEMLVNMLLDRGACATDRTCNTCDQGWAPSDEDDTVLSLAIPRAGKALLHRLIDAGCDASIPATDGLLSVMNAMLHHDNSIFGDRPSLLHAAAFFCNDAAVDVLMDAQGPDAIARRDLSGRIPLQWAAMGWASALMTNDADAPALIRTLAGAPDLIHTYDRHGNTPLHYAVDPRFDLSGGPTKPLARFLCTQLNASPRMRNHEGNNALLGLCKSTLPQSPRMDLGLVALFLELDGRAVDVNDVNDANNTALHLAAAVGDEPAVRLLLNRGAMVDVKNDRLRTPLHEVADAQAFSAIEGVSVEGQIAAQQAMLDLLVGAGRDCPQLHERDDLGKTPRQLAEETRTRWREHEAQVQARLAEDEAWMREQERERSGSRAEATGEDE